MLPSGSTGRIAPRNWWVYAFDAGALRSPLSQILCIALSYRYMRTRARRICASVGLLLAGLNSDAHAQQATPDDLVKDARNPLADLVSVQVQPNFNFGVGEARDTEYVFDFQPVVPIPLPA